MGGAQSSIEIPAFMRCDGHYQIAEDSGVDRPWFGWVRLEGHGGLMLKASDEHADGISGEWKVLDESTVELMLSKSPPGQQVAALLMREGDDVDRVVIAAVDSSREPHQWVSFEFVAEEHDH